MAAAVADSVIVRLYPEFKNKIDIHLVVPPFLSKTPVIIERNTLYLEYLLSQSLVKGWWRKSTLIFI